MTVTKNVTACYGVTKIDVENLLEWAYRRQKVDIVIDRGIGLSHAEAKAAGITRYQTSADWAAIDRYAALGCFVDQIGYDTGQVHPDAEALHEVVRRMGDPVRLLLIRHAKGGTRPEWGEGADIRYEPVWKGQPRYDIRGRPAKGSYRLIYGDGHHPNGCYVRPRQHLPYIEAQRDDYRAWHHGLLALVEHFARHPLARHAVLPPAAPAEPWLTQSKPC